MLTLQLPLETTNVQEQAQIKKRRWRFRKLLCYTIKEFNEFLVAFSFHIDYLIIANPVLFEKVMVCNISF